MSRYIDADALEEIKEIADDAFEWGTYVVKMSAIREVPTADVVEVVRCKDCIHQRYCQKYILHKGFTVERRDLKYCSYGERREDERNI